MNDTQTRPETLRANDFTHLAYSDVFNARVKGGMAGLVVVWTPLTGRALTATVHDRKTGEAVHSWANIIPSGRGVKELVEADLLIAVLEGSA